MRTADTLSGEVLSSLADAPSRNEAPMRTEPLMEEGALGVPMRAASDAPRRTGTAMGCGRTGTAIGCELLPLSRTGIAIGKEFMSAPVYAAIATGCHGACALRYANLSTGWPVGDAARGGEASPPR
jgi:hypothetical protein